VKSRGTTRENSVNAGCIRDRRGYWAMARGPVGGFKGRDSSCKHQGSPGKTENFKNKKKQMFITRQKKDRRWGSSKRRRALQRLKRRGDARHKKKGRKESPGGAKNIRK